MTTAALAATLSGRTMPNGNSRCASSLDTLQWVTKNRHPYTWFVLNRAEGTSLGGCIFGGRTAGRAARDAG